MLTESTVPTCLQQIPSPPKELFHRGESLEELLKRPCVAIVGSRNISAYGREVTHKLSYELAQQGIVIISGLAYGVDATAHRAALEAGGLTIAVLPASVDEIVPTMHTRLAEQILSQGGALVSEYPPGSIAHKQNFIARNRLVAGLAKAVLITEAAEKSGSLHTARFALDQGKEVLAVPGNITSLTSVGTNNLLRKGATPITSVSDVLHVLGLKTRHKASKVVKGRNQNEQTVIDLLASGLTAGDELLKQSQLTPSEFNQVLTMLEIGAKIRPLGNNHWTLS